MNDGGVYLNVGSAVVLPEVFLKAVSVVRNLGNPLANFTTVNFDFLQHYRPRVNVVERPHAKSGGRGYAITGHHELMMPLLAAALIESEDDAGARCQVPGSGKTSDGERPEFPPAEAGCPGRLNVSFWSYADLWSSSALRFPASWPARWQ